MPLDTPLTAASVSPRPEPQRSLDPRSGRGGCMCRWHVAWTLPRREALALKAVRRTSFAGALLPLIRYRDQYRRTVIAPLWPGYLLVLFNAERDPWGELTVIPEISGFISHGPGKPTPLPDNTVPELLASMAPAGYVESLPSGTDPTDARAGAQDALQADARQGWHQMAAMDAGARTRLLYRLFGERAARQHLEAAA